MPDHPLTFNDLIQTDNDGLMDCGATITACGLAFAAGRGTAFEIARMLLDGFDGDPRHRALREFVNDGYLDGLDPTSPNGNILLALHHVDADDWRVVWNMGGVANLLAHRDALAAEVDRLQAEARAFREALAERDEATALLRRLAGDGRLPETLAAWQDFTAKLDAKPGAPPMMLAPVSAELQAAIAAAGPGSAWRPVEPGGTIQERLAALKAEGLDLGTCLAAFGPETDEERAYADAACGKSGVSVDAVTPVSMGDDDGAYVLAWVWVTAKEAGIETPDEEDGK